MRKPALSLLVACGVYQIGLGVYFIALRPTMRPEDERYTGLTLDALKRIAPAMPSWLDRVFIVLGGHALATGLLVTLAAIIMWTRAVEPWVIVAFAAAGVSSVALMSGVNFAIRSDFRWSLLVPALIWAGAALLLTVEAIAARGSSGPHATS
jgi:hypothetical protein